MAETDHKSTPPASPMPLYIGAVAALILLGAGMWGSHLPPTAMAPAAAAMTAPAEASIATVDATAKASMEMVKAAEPKAAEPAIVAKAAEPAMTKAAEPAAAMTKAAEPAMAKAAEPVTAAATAATPTPAPAKMAANAAPAPKPDVDVAELLKPGTLPDNVLGEATAPITIVEYASMSCPHCADFHKRVFPELKTKYIDTGKARMIFREFPLNPPAQTVAMLARCVGPMRYNAFVATMFERQDEWLTNDDFLGKVQGLSKQMGFTDDSFKKCITDPVLLKGINDSRERGDKFGVNSTPTFFVNGVKLKGQNGSHEMKDFEDLMTPFLKG